MKSLSKFLIILGLAVSLATALNARAGHSVKDSATPIVFSVTPSSPGPDMDVVATVQMSSPSVGGDTMAIGSTDPNAFTSLPPDVYVPAGQSSVSFTCHTSPTYSGWTVIAATANGGTAIAITR